VVEFLWGVGWCGWDEELKACFSVTVGGIADWRYTTAWRSTMKTTGSENDINDGSKTEMVTGYSMPEDDI